MVALEFAKSGRGKCKTCSGGITEGSLQFGTARRVEEFLSIDWHHERCFWSRRASKYYKRGNKRSNTLLRLVQFSIQHILDADRLQSLKDKILEKNQKWGTKEALEKEGIPVPVTVAESVSEEVEEEKKPAAGRKRKAAEVTAAEPRVTRSVRTRSSAASK